MIRIESISQGNDHAWMCYMSTDTLKIIDLESYEIMFPFFYEKSKRIIEMMDYPIICKGIHTGKKLNLLYQPIEREYLWKICIKTIRAELLEFIETKGIGQMIISKLNLL